MIYCLIVDDEPLAQQILKQHVEDVAELKLVKICNNAIEAFEVLHREHIDLIFLDIKMPGPSGIEFVQSLKNPPAIIFTTAYAHYAAASYDLEAIDYLLKPITLERFKKSLNKFLKIQAPAVEEQKDHVYFKVSGKLVKVFYSDLQHAQSIKDYLMVTTSAGNLIVHMTMKHLSELLPSNQFVRVHRSFLVNRKAITVIGKNHLFLNENQIPLGESYRDEITRIKRSL